MLPYVARLHATWFASAPDEIHRRIPGTLVFADISGFTALTERLSRKGKVGAEEMSDALNAVFSDILEPAHEDGADLVKWGGDAVLLLFTDDHHEARACRAAYNMRARLKTVGSLGTTSGAVKLRMSVGIHSGEFDFFLVGDPTHHRELLVSGPEVSKCVRLESIANAGDIAVSNETLVALGASYEAKRVSEDGVLLKGCPDPPPAQLSTTALDLDISTLLPAEIRAHLLRGEADPEHRDIAVGFVKFTGTDRVALEDGPGAVALALDEVVRNVSSATDEFGVTFFETDLDADGGKVMLAAGVPTSSGHHAERMLRATRLMLDRAGRLPLKIGVNYGHVFAGDFGPSFRRTYSIKGDPINLAARIMGKAAPGTLLASRAAVESSETVFDTRVLEPFMVKGKTEPVQAFEIGAVVQSPRDRRSHASLLVGRGAELELLETALDRLSSYGGQAIDIVGPPGIGKSRLLAEAVRMAGDRVVHMVQCVEYDGASPYHLFWVLMHNIMGLTVGSTGDEAVAAFAGHVERVAPDLMPWFPLLCTPLEYDVEDTAVTKGLDDEFRRAKTEEVVAELLYRLLPDQTLLVFDDVQFLDSASVGVLNRLVSDLSPRPMLVILGRHDVESGWTPPPGVEIATLKLEPLSAEDSMRMVQGAHEDRPLPAQVAQQLAEKAGGNPLFLQSLVEAAGPTGDVTDLPDTVADLVTTRIDRLPPEDRTILRRAAVLGTGFDLEQLPLLFDEPPEEAALARLDEFLHVERARRWVTFRHAIMREVAYSGLPYRQRQQLHARIGAAMEKAGGAVGARPELLSLHFYHAHRFEKAWAYARQAGDVAKAKFANAEAADQYVRAVDAARRLPSQVVPRSALGITYERLADAWFTIGLVDPSTKAYREAYSLLREERVDRARVADKQARIEQRLRRLPQSLARISRELKRLGQEEDARLAKARSLLLTRYALGKLNQGRYDRAIDFAVRALEEGKRAGDTECLAQAYSGLHVIHLTAGRPMSENWGELCLDAYVELGDLVGQAHCTNNLAYQAHGEDRWSDAVEMFGRAASTFASLGDTANEGNATCNEAEVMVNQGRYLEALPLLDRAIIAARSTSDDELVALAVRQLGKAYLRAGNVTRGLELLDEAGGMFVAIEEEGELAGVDVLRAEALLYDGDPKGALRVCGELLSSGAREEHETSLRWIAGFALLDLGRSRDAADEFELGVHVARAAKDRYSEAVNLTGLALTGEPTAEADPGAAAAEIFDSLGVSALPRGLPGPTT
ncbi:MAG TPA: adenylate/guanylate cyclase domain-containing protein [Nocardioidaceae bacterium]|nr:adenylate/guanylate cyclase domain-containing protein [Nocardioidaceae bacterium]